MLDIISRAKTRNAFHPLESRSTWCVYPLLKFPSARSIPAVHFYAEYRSLGTRLMQIVNFNSHLHAAIQTLVGVLKFLWSEALEVLQLSD